MLRVKDAILFIEEWLASMERLVDGIVVVDNGSTDGTLEILERSPKVSSIDRTVGFHEGRDKILAYQRARERGAQWILWLDADEIFEDSVTREMLDRYMDSRLFTRVYFWRFNLQADGRRFDASLDHPCRMPWPNRIMWRDAPTGYFQNVKIHNGAIQGIGGLRLMSSLRLRHLGDMHWGHLLHKTAAYLAVDPGRSAMYLGQRNRALPGWNWYERPEHPWLVRAQMSALWAGYAYHTVRTHLGMGATGP